jgi:hypothetical protein
MRISLYCWAIVLAAAGTAFGQDTNFATGPQYLMNYGSPLFARPISTPSLSLSGPPLEVGATIATADLIAGAQIQTTSPSEADALPIVDFFPIYYGTTPVQLIEISFRERAELPASILDAGVWEFTTAQALRERGIGVTLGEAAAYSKSRTGHANRVYTNTDIERLKN